MEEQQLSIQPDDTDPDTSENEQPHDDANVFEYFGEETSEKKPIYSKILSDLYDLTKIDEELLEIEEEKGDLPLKIQDFKEKIENLDSRLTEDKQKLKAFETEEKGLIKENKNYEDKMNKYDDLKYKAKNNKEYDEIVKTIDNLMDIIQKNEARLKELKSFQDTLVKDVISNNRILEELKSELKENQSQLNALNKQFEDEEKELNAKRKKIIGSLSEEHKGMYERINRSLKGEATAIVRKGNCSGCYNSVPPQREIEIRMAEKIFLCQSCGRILIDDSLITDITR